MKMLKQKIMSGRRRCPTTTEGYLSAFGMHNVSVISILMLWHVTASQLLEPHERIDAMGTYRLTNSEQCQRLCWYRRLCTSYSFKANTDLERNCVLHFSQDESVVNPPGVNSDSSGWTERTVQQPVASSSSPSCANSRPCGPAEVCFPEFSGSFRCMPCPVYCGIPEVIANAVEMTGLGLTVVQGATATVQCLPDFEQVPHNVSMEIQCQVNSRWSQFPGECVQALQCGDPEVIANAVQMTVPGGPVGPGATATVQCLPDFVEVPRDVSMEIQCQVNSLWSQFTGECVQALFRVTPVTALYTHTRLPWTAPAAELKACISGVFDTSTRATINLWAGPNDSDDKILHMDFRHNYGADSYKKIVLVSQINGYWGAEVSITSPEMPLEEGDAFRMSFHVTKDLFQLTMLRNNVLNVTWSVPITDWNFQLERAHYISTKPVFSLNDVSLVNTCG